MARSVVATGRRMNNAEMFKARFLRPAGELSGLLRLRQRLVRSAILSKNR
jgi:hypothetical protein